MTETDAKEIEEIYSHYLDLIHPLILNYEVIAEEFPIEILNEIRSIFSHISKCYKFNDEKDIVKTNIHKAKNHFKRAALDGFKYTCMAYQKQATEFKKCYDRVLTLVDNGEFANEFFNLQIEARRLLKEAKKIESDSSDVEECYSAYEKAFNKYNSLYVLIEQAKMKCEKVNSLVDKDYKKKFRLSLIGNFIMGALTIGSFIFGIIGLVNMIN